MFKGSLHLATASAAAVSGCVCEPGAIEWIHLWFNDCVYTSWDLAGFIIGFSSIMFWIVAQMPQFVTNILNQSAEALSPWFLFQWLAGDILNLVGCVLTGDQLASETYTACYYILSDCVVLGQYFYYQYFGKDKVYLSDDSVHKPETGYHTFLDHIYPDELDVRDCSSRNYGATNNAVTTIKSKESSTTSEQFGLMARGEMFKDFNEVKGNSQDAQLNHLRRNLRRTVLEYGLEYGPASASTLNTQHAARLTKIKLPGSGKKKALCFTGLLATVGLVGRQQFNSGPSDLPSQNLGSSTGTGRKLLALCTDGSSRVGWIRQTGAVCGAVSAVFYLGSRVAQLKKNRQRRSAEGLSLSMVICAILANVTYGLAILIRLKSWEDFLSKLPWLVGSLGTVSLDVAILLQVHYFSSRYSKVGKANEQTPLLQV